MAAQLKPRIFITPILMVIFACLLLFASATEAGAPGPDTVATVTDARGWGHYAFDGDFADLGPLPGPVSIELYAFDADGIGRIEYSISGPNLNTGSQIY